MLYPVLHRLERLGHVEARWEVAESGRRRKYYRITSAGPDSARRGAPAVAGGRRDAAGHLAALAVRSPPGVVHAAAREPDDAGSGSTRYRSRSRSTSGGATSAAGRRSTRSTSRSWRTTCASRSRCLAGAGLADDEAFLVAVKRMGDLDALSREFAREHSDRLWKQLVVSRSDVGGAAGGGANGRRRRVRARGGGGRRRQGAGALRDASWTTTPAFYARNASLFVLPLLTGYFAWKRQLDRRHARLAGARRSSRRPSSPTSTRSRRTAPPRR